MIFPLQWQAILNVEVSVDIKPSIEIESINVTGAEFGAAAFTQIEGFHENGQFGLREGEKDRQGIQYNLEALFRLKMVIAALKYHWEE